MKNSLLGSAVFLFSLAFYLHTLAPTIMPNDSAELTTCAYLLSIAHATGYPLYLLAGKLFTFLPLGEIAFRMNLMSACFGALACLIAFWLVLILTGQRIPGLIAAVCLCFSCTFWQLSTKAEVYTLNALLTGLLLLILLAWRKNKNTKFLYLFGLLYGLSLGNHLTIGLFWPAFGYFFIKNHFSLTREFINHPSLTREFIKNHPSLIREQIFIPLLLFLFGLGIYLYLPLRSFSTAPVVHWDKITTFNQFFFFVSGGHFKKMLFSTPILEVAGSLGEFFLLLITQFPVFGFSLGLFGLVKNFSIDKETGKLFSAISILLLFFCINYDIVDIDNFYLPIYLVFAVWIGMGIAFLMKIAKQKKVVIGVIATLLFLSYQLTYGWVGIKFDRSHCLAASNLCRQSLSQMAPDSLLISNWTYATCFWYWQHVLNVRGDVEILSRSDKKDWKAIVDKEVKNRPVYLIKAEKRVAQNYRLIPEGRIFKVLRPDTQKRY